MLKYSSLQKLKHQIGKIPGTKSAYDTMRLMFNPSFREDGLNTLHNADFLKNEEFLIALNSAKKQNPKIKARWRVHVTQWAGFHASKLKGHFVECGVYKGFLSRSVMTYIDFPNLSPRKFYLFDTFSGLVEELVSENDKAAAYNEYTDCYEEVKESFKNDPNVIIIKGPVPDTLSKVEIDQVAYLSIDMNCTIPEVAALEHFWPKLSAGAVVVLDDYGFRGHMGQKMGADKFAESVNTKILSLPTGQGILFKI